MDSMFSQYLAWYQRYRTKYGSNTAVLMQVGKFYEIYDRLNLTTNSTYTNIREIADLCSLNLSEGQIDTQNVMKLCGGFPEQSLPKFERQLLDSGYTVVIVNQKKKSNGEVEERIVERISSPGIYENRYAGSIRDQATDSCLIGILLERNDARSYYVGATAIDIQTGNAWSMECVMPFIQNSPNIDNLEPFFLMHPPAEIVCYCDKITEKDLRIWFHLPLTTVIHIRPISQTKPSPEFIRNAFSLASNLQPHIALGLEKYQQAYNCMGLTLSFIEEHIPSLLKKLRNNTVWVPEHRVRLGNAALEQLNIISQSSSNSSSESLLHFYQKTFTAVGRRALRERFITPISDITELRNRFCRIDFLRDQDDATIEKYLRSVYDLSRLHRKLHLLTVNYSDIQHLLLTYKSIWELIDKFNNTPIQLDKEHQNTVSAWFAQHQSAWSVERIKTADPTILNRTHPWARDIYPNLDAVEDSWFALIKDIRAYLQPYSDQNTPITVGLSEHTVFEFGITKKRFEKLPNTFKFHASSKTGGILESKELLEFQKRGSTIQKLWLSEQDKQWLASLEQWSKSADQSINQMPISEYVTRWVAAVDADFALARCAKEYGLITPTFIASSESAPASVQIEQLRHPIIERIHTGSPYVRHDLSLGSADSEQGPGCAKSGLLVYGSNSSGKSSLMKALGIAVLCAQAGIPVAATSMTLAPYTGIFTRILGNDNLWAALSSFAVEMTEFRAILKYANEKSLVLGDELCSGTETRSATAIVSAGIQTMVKRGAQFLLATHLHEISELEEIRRLSDRVKFAHLAMEYDAATKTILYKRHLQEGSGSSLYGLEVCYGLDMDPDFLELARKCRTTSKASRYNAAVIVRACEVCKSERSLESHHIIHQADSKNGFVEPGAKVHRASNLTVLCEMCHKDHHGGRLTIQGWADTSVGRVLQWSLAVPDNKKKIIKDQDQEQDQDKEQDQQDRLKILLSKGKKEKEILALMQADFDITLSQLRKLKKSILK